jgi:hypothetical protein
MKRIGLVLLQLIILSLPAALCRPAAAHTMFFEVDGKTVEVEVSEPPANAVTEDGRALAQWRPEDAARIVEALSGADIAWAIPGILGGLKMGDRTPVCLTIEMDDTEPLTVTLPGRIVADEHGRMAWTPAQIEAIQAALHDAGRDDALGRIFALRAGHHNQDSDAAPMSATPLAPGCNECLSGTTCLVNGKSSCCSNATGTACTHCRFCNPKRALEPGAELP